MNKGIKGINSINRVGDGTTEFVARKEPETEKQTTGYEGEISDTATAFSSILGNTPEYWRAMFPGYLDGSRE